MVQAQKIIVLIVILVLIFQSGLSQTHTYSNRLIDFNQSGGRYSSEKLFKDFGNSKFFDTRDHAIIVDSTLCIIFKKGEKVRNTGASTKIDIPHARKYVLEYKIKYDKNFESGLHGKQFGFRLGKGYDGGRAEEARNNGDGGSVRIQFDAYDNYISNQLYVYYSGMSGKYGNNPGDMKFNFARNEWNLIRLIVCLESAAGAKDGYIQVYHNEIMQIEIRNMEFIRMNDNRQITGIAFESFPGGGGIFPITDNFLYVDDMKWWMEEE